MPTSDSDSSRPVRAWHVAAGVLLVAVGGLILYGFWPRLTGQASADDERPDTEDVSDSVAQIDVVQVERMDFPVRTEATGRRSALNWPRPRPNSSKPVPSTPSTRAIPTSDR